MTELANQEKVEPAKGLLSEAELINGVKKESS
jgi:hypothetical protein